MNNIDNINNTNTTIQQPENVQIDGFTSMLNNAIRYNKKSIGVEDMKVYNMNLKFITNENSVVIDDLNVSERQDPIKNDNSSQSNISESPITDKYNEYDSLMNSPEMNRKTLGTVIKEKMRDVKIELTRKPGKALL